LKILASPIKRSRVEAVIAKIIAETGASGIASMGKVIGLASTTWNSRRENNFFTS
jgi:uncharacterized protein YqeY